jgi:MFS family permease
LSSGSFFSTLSEIAGPELLDRASAIEATSLNLAVIVGPALGGVLVGVTGAARTVELQAALTIVVAILVAANPAFEARGPDRSATLSDALRRGLRALARQRVLLITSVSSSLAAFGWGLMLIGFPVYAVQTIHSQAHASGYLWAAVAAGSILGTFVLHGPPSLRRIGLSYGILGLSALLWPLAGTLVVGIALIGLTGLALSAGAVAGGAIHDPLALIVVFTAVNLVAAGAVLTRGPANAVT